MLLSLIFKTDEQAPLPATLQAIVRRVATGLEDGSDFVYVPR